MKLSDDIAVQRTVDHIIEDTNIPWAKFKNSRILVTGATGLIGSQLILALLDANKEKNLNLTVLAIVRNIEKANEIFKYAEKDTIEFIIQDITQELSQPLNIDYIIHGASMTNSKDFVDFPVETITTALVGTENILKLVRQSKIKGMVYLSSLEIYGVVDFKIEKVTENMNGILDCMSVRSSYSEGKRMVECMCAAYASEFNAPVMVGRFSQTFGAGVNYNDNRVFAQFARSIIEGKDIVLKTDGSTERSYCSVEDAICAIFTILLKGEPGQAYNVANPLTFISIRDMAKLLIERYPESGSNVVFDIESDISKLGYNPKIRLNLCVDKLKKLGWQPKIMLEEMFDDLIDSMKRKNSF